MVLLRPRFRSTGRRAPPTASSSAKFWALRVPTWSMSAYSDTRSTSAGVSTSVTTGNPVASRRSARWRSPSRPSPRNEYGDDRGLKAPPRNMLAPASATSRAVASTCSRLSTAHGPAMTTKDPSPKRTPETSTTVGSGCHSLVTCLYGLLTGIASTTPGRSQIASRIDPGLLPSTPIARRSAPGSSIGSKPRSRMCLVTLAICSGVRLHVHEDQHRLILREAGVMSTSSCSGRPAGHWRPGRRPAPWSARSRRCCRPCSRPSPRSPVRRRRWARP